MKDSFTPHGSLAKIKRYCAYQERSHRQVRTRLFEYGLTTDDVDQLIALLIIEGFLNEERYAKAFAGGKFRMKKWGRLKIIHALEAEGLSRNCIRIGLQEIDDQTYEEELRKLLIKKDHETTSASIYTQRDILSKFAIAKGYEPELVWRVLRQLLPG